MGDVTNTATTLVVEKGKEVESGSDKAPVHTRRLWLENILNSKIRNIVPDSVPLEDMVSKCLWKTPKAKKLKTISKIDFDDSTGNWTIEIARPDTDEVIANSTAKDFTVEKLNLGVGTRAADAYHLETSTKKILNRTWKDERDKHEMKEILRRMVEYIEEINNPNPQLLSQLPMSFDPKSPSNQKTGTNTEMQAHYKNCDGVVRRNLEIRCKVFYQFEQSLWWGVNGDEGVGNWNHELEKRRS